MATAHDPTTQSGADAPVAATGSGARFRPGELVWVNTGEPAPVRGTIGKVLPQGGCPIGDQSPNPALHVTEEDIVSLWEEGRVKCLD